MRTPVCSKGCRIAKCQLERSWIDARVRGNHGGGGCGAAGASGASATSYWNIPPRVNVRNRWRRKSVSTGVRPIFFLDAGALLIAQRVEPVREDAFVELPRLTLDRTDIGGSTDRPLR